MQCIILYRASNGHLHAVFGDDGIGPAVFESETAAENYVETNGYLASGQPDVQIVKVEI